MWICPFRQNPFLKAWSHIADAHPGGSGSASPRSAVAGDVRDFPGVFRVRVRLRAGSRLAAVAGVIRRLSRNAVSGLEIRWSARLLSGNFVLGDTNKSRGVHKVKKNAWAICFPTTFGQPSRLLKENREKREKHEEAIPRLLITESMS